MDLFAVDGGASAHRPLLCSVGSMPTGSTEPSPVKQVVSGGTKRKRWTAEEDEALKNFVGMHGTRSWKLIAAHLSKRTGKQCRERWHSHLRDDIRKGAWSLDEERKLIQLHKHFGNRWANISKHLRGRSNNAVKNYWNGTLRHGENIAHLLVDDKLPDCFPDGIPDLPSIPQPEDLPSTTHHRLSAPTALTVDPSLKTITPLEAANINHLLRASPTSALAQLVQYPVSEGDMPSSNTAICSLEALMAMLRASSRHELFHAMQRLQDVIKDLIDFSGGNSVNDLS